MKDFMKDVKTIAVLGLSPDKSKASHIVAKYLQESCFKIIPIYPKEDFILNEKVFRALEDVNEKIDLLVLFRKGEVASEIFDTVLKKGIKRFWLQLDIKNEAVKAKCLENNIAFVQDKCIMQELKALK